MWFLKLLYMLLCTEPVWFRDIGVAQKEKNIFRPTQVTNLLNSHLTCVGEDLGETWGGNRVQHWW